MTSLAREIDSNLALMVIFYSVMDWTCSDLENEPAISWRPFYLKRRDGSRSSFQCKAIGKRFPGNQENEKGRKGKGELTFLISHMRYGTKVEVELCGVVCTLHPSLLALSLTARTQQPEQPSSPIWPPPPRRGT